jgi:AcrR family transcriptional regulator
MVEKEKKSNRKIRAIETKKKIYETANELFRKYGYENVSVDSIVEAAGVSKGAFYVHFDSKDTLVATVINDYVNEVDLDYKSYIDSFRAETTSSDILISLIGKIADILNYTIGCDQMKSLYKAQITKSVDTNAVMGYTRELYKMFNDIIGKGVQQGEFKKDISVDTLAKHCLIAYRGLTYEWCIRYPDFDLKDQVLKHFEILLTGIKKQ